MLKSLVTNLDRFFFGRVMVTTTTTTFYRYMQPTAVNLKGFRIEENDFSPPQDALK